MDYVSFALYRMMDICTCIVQYFGMAALFQRRDESTFIPFYFFDNQFEINVGVM